MPVAAYRVCRHTYARLDGEGSRKVGGRWNSPGRAVVYMAQSVALAVLENLVHMCRQDYPTGYVIVERKAGDDWNASYESAVLRVPSAAVQGEWNYLINPQHLDFAQITVKPPVPMRFDERLFEST